MTNYITEMMKTAGVEKADTKYPKFTAKKQLEIIKLICANYEFSATRDRVFEDKDKDYYVGILEEPAPKTHFNRTNPNFTQALADFTSSMLYYEMLDKQKVKEILEK